MTNLIYCILMCNQGLPAAFCFCPLCKTSTLFTQCLEDSLQSFAIPKIAQWYTERGLASEHKPNLELDIIALLPPPPHPPPRPCSLAMPPASRIATFWAKQKQAGRRTISAPLFSSPSAEHPPPIVPMIGATPCHMGTPPLLTAQSYACALRNKFHCLQWDFRAVYIELQPISSLSPPTH